MHPLKKIKILKSTSTNIRSFLQWDDNGLVTVIIPKKRSVLQYIKNPVIYKDDRLLCLKRGSSNWMLTLTYHKVILISINITMENTYYDNKFTTTIVKIKHENELTIEAPLLILKGLTNIAPNLNLISETSLFIYGNVTCDNLSLKAQKNIRLNNEAIIQCKTFSTISLKLFHYGSICNLKDDKILNLNIEAEICHINMEGRIGIRHKLYHPNEICTTVIKGSINASLRNFGNIKAISEISLKVKEILSLKENHEDTAQRLLSPVRSPSMSSLATLSPLSTSSSPRAHNSQNLSVSTSTILPSIQLPMSPAPLSKPRTSYSVSKNSSSLSLNIQTKTNLLLSSQNCNNSYLTTSMVALSPPTSTSTNMIASPSPLLTPKRLHSPITNPSKSPLSHTSSTSPFLSKDQRIHGSIKAENINLNIEKSMEDMAQLIGENVTLKVGNECICEELSECTANSFVIKSCKNVAIFGHVKFNVAKMIAVNKILIAKFGYFETINELSIFVGDFTKRTKNAGMIIKGHLKSNVFCCDSSGFFSLSKNGIFDAFDARITSNHFYNSSLISSEQYLYLTTKKFVHNSNTKIKVGGYFHLNANSVKGCFNGSIEANHIYFIPMNKIVANGPIKCEICEVLISHKKTIFCIKNDLDIRKKFIVKQEKKYLNDNGLHEIYNILINGNLSTKQFDAKNTAIKMNTNGCIKFNAASDDNILSLPYFYVDQIHSCIDTFVILPITINSSNYDIICNKTWICGGNVIQSDRELSSLKEFSNPEKRVLNGSIKANKFIVRSKPSKDIEMNCVLEASEVKIEAKMKEVKIDKSIDCKNISIFAKNVAINGEICNYSYGKKLLINFNLEQVILNGNIGTKANKCVTNEISGNISGDLINHGIIKSENLTELKMKSLLAPQSFGRIPSISSLNMELEFEKDCEDCSQMNGNLLKMNVKGDALCRKNTTWNSENIILNCVGNVFIDGTINSDDLALFCQNKVITSNNSNIRIGNTILACGVFDQNGFWKSKSLQIKENDEIFTNGKMEIESFVFTFCKSIIFNESSDIKTEVSNILFQENANNEVVFKGNFLTKFLNIENNEILQIFETAILTIDDAIIKSKNVQNNGTININNKVIITAEEFEQQKSISNFSCQNLLKINAKNVININGSVKSNGNILLSTDSISLNTKGNIFSKDLCEIFAKIINSEGEIFCDNKISIEINEIESAGNIDAGNLLQINATKTICNSGRLKSADILLTFEEPNDTISDGICKIEKNGEILAEKLCEITAKTFLVDGMLHSGNTLNIKSNDIISNGKVTSEGLMKIDAKQSFLNNGSIESNDKLLMNTNKLETNGSILSKDLCEIIADLFALNGTLHSNDKLNIVANDISNNGKITAENFMKIDGKQLFLNNALMESKDNLYISSELLKTLKDNKISSLGLLEINSISILLEGNLKSDNKIKISCNDLASNGEIICKKEMQIDAKELFINNGSIKSFDNLNISTNKFESKGNILSKALCEIIADLLALDGTIHSDKEMNMKANDLINNGKIFSKNSIEIDAKQCFTNNGIIESDDSLQISSNSLKTTKDSKILSFESLEIETVTILSEGDFKSNNKIYIKSDKFVNNGNLDADNSILINSKEFITNNGSFETKDNLILSTNKLETKGTFLSKNLCKITAVSVSLDDNLSCNKLHFKEVKEIQIYGNVNCDTCEVDAFESSTGIEIDGIFHCKNIFTVLQNSNDKSDKSNMLLIGGQLLTNYINAINTSIKMKPNSQILIQNNELHYSDNYQIHCKNIHISAETILMTKSRRKIICSNDWVQEGIFLQTPNFESIKNETITKTVFQGNVEAKNIFIQPTNAKANIEIDGYLKTENLQIITDKGKAFISQNSIIKCDIVKITAAIVFNFGQIYQNNKNDIFELTSNSDLFVNGNSGIIGNDQIITSLLNITGDFLNYGIIKCEKNMEIHLRNFLSTKENPFPKSDFLDFQESPFGGFSDSPKSVSAKKVKMFAERGIEDCGQLSANIIDIIAKRNIICEKNSIWKAGRVTIFTEQNFNIEGDIKLQYATLSANKILTTLDGNAEIEITSVKAKEFEIAGKWQCENFLLEGGNDSNIEKALINRKFKEVPTMLEEIYNEVFKINESSKIMCQNATVYTQSFENSGKFEVQNAQIYSKTLFQQKGGIMSAKNNLNVVVKDVTNFEGSLLSHNLNITAFDSFISSTEIQVDKTEIAVLDSKTLIELNNEMVVIGPLTILTLLPLIDSSDNETDVTQSGICINGILIAETIKSEIPIKVEENSKVILERNPQTSKKIQRILDVPSIDLKQNATLKAINYENTQVQIKIADDIVFDGTMNSHFDGKETDCVPYFDKEKFNHSIKFTKFVAYLRV